MAVIKSLHRLNTLIHNFISVRLTENVLPNLPACQLGMFK